MSDVKKTGDFDVLMEKWNDVLTRDIAWELKGSSFKKEDFCKENIVKADFRDGEQTFHFEGWSIVGEYEGRDGRKQFYGDELSGISVSYVPDSSGKKLSLQLSFMCFGATPYYYTKYEVIVGFKSESGKKEGKAETTINNGYDKSKPRNSDYECIVGENFYNILIGFCKKMKETAMEDIKKKEQAKQNNIKDEFDSL